MPKCRDNRRARIKRRRKEAVRLANKYERLPESWMLMCAAAELAAGGIKVLAEHVARIMTTAFDVIIANLKKKLAESNVGPEKSEILLLRGDLPSGRIESLTGGGQEGWDAGE